MQSNSVIKARADLRIQQGDTFKRTFVFKQDGVLWDLSSITKKLSVKDSAGTEILVFNNSDFTFSATGTYIITSSSATTNTLTPGVYSWDLQLTDSGNVQTYAYGQFIIESQTAI